jgi:hypothetical protein
MTFTSDPNTNEVVIRRFVAPEDARDQLVELLLWCNANEAEVYFLFMIIILLNLFFLNFTI